MDRRVEIVLELAGFGCLVAAAAVTFGLGAALATSGALLVGTVIAANLVKASKR